ncbi:molecular chaperone GrpE [Desulfuromusa kysingii]|uniref:Protein GrpE n=1 Tax=Desulfuromusa kysingii TaxID=37625 RepID=A0A1H3ZU37_9BACT|nr:nucleotide exchange factor GrpE [Desulfuromusa kysingii]SEA27145.1 molecular chaperone GrpE [Desulfuromusa kysingii]
MNGERRQNFSATHGEIDTEADNQPLEEVVIWKERYLRLLADLENIKKRLARNAAQDIHLQQEALLKDILPVADGLSLALRHTSAEEDSRGILQGLELNLNLLEKFFTKYNVEEIEALGQPFDPSLHESIGMVQYPGVLPNTVVRVEQKGYLHDGKLLRPAQVLIASR